MISVCRQKIMESFQGRPQGIAPTGAIFVFCDFCVGQNPVETHGRASNFS